MENDKYLGGAADAPSDQVLHQISQLSHAQSIGVAIDIACAALGKSRAADALDSQPTVPDGWMLVPIEPTDAMYFAACRAFTAWRYTTSEQPDFTHRDSYRAMLMAVLTDPASTHPTVAAQQGSMGDDALRMLMLSWKFAGTQDESDTAYRKILDHLRIAPTITLTGHQLAAALDLIAPGLPRDPEELDNDLTFGVRQHKDDDGIVSTGMCCWNDDTDGVLPLDEHPDDIDPQQEGSEAGNG